MKKIEGKIIPGVLSIHFKRQGSLENYFIRRKEFCVNAENFRNKGFCLSISNGDGVIIYSEQFETIRLFDLFYTIETVIGAELGLKVQVEPWIEAYSTFKEGKHSWDDTKYDIRTLDVETDAGEKFTVDADQTTMGEFVAAGVNIFDTWKRIYGERNVEKVKEIFLQPTDKVRNMSVSDFYTIYHSANYKPDFKEIMSKAAA